MNLFAITEGQGTLYARRREHWMRVWSTTEIGDSSKDENLWFSVNLAAERSSPSHCDTPMSVEDVSSSQDPTLSWWVNTSLHALHDGMTRGQRRHVRLTRWDPLCGEWSARAKEDDWLSGTESQATRIRRSTANENKKLAPWRKPKEESAENTYRSTLEPLANPCTSWRRPQFAWKTPHWL